MRAHVKLHVLHCVRSCSWRWQQHPIWSSAPIRSCEAWLDSCSVVPAKPRPPKQRCLMGFARVASQERPRAQAFTMYRAQQYDSSPGMKSCSAAVHQNALPAFAHSLDQRTEKGCRHMCAHQRHPMPLLTQEELHRDRAGKAAGRQPIRLRGAVCA